MPCRSGCRSCSPPRSASPPGCCSSARRPPRHDRFPLAHGARHGGGHLPRARLLPDAAAGGGDAALAAPRPALRAGGGPHGDLGPGTGAAEGSPIPYAAERAAAGRRGGDRRGMAVPRHLRYDRIRAAGPAPFRLADMNRLLSGIVLLLWAAVCLAQPLQQAHSIEGVTEHRLPNGLRVLTLPDPGIDTLTVHIAYMV